MSEMLHGGWWHEHWHMLVTGAGVAVAMAAWAINSFMSRFARKEYVHDTIDACKTKVDTKDNEILLEVKELGKKLDHLDDRRRDDAKNNAAEHQKIIADFGGQLNTILTHLIQGEHK